MQTLTEPLLVQVSAAERCAGQLAAACTAAADAAVAADAASEAGRAAEAAFQEARKQADASVASQQALAQAMAAMQRAQKHSAHSIAALPSHVSSCLPARCAPPCLRHLCMSCATCLQAGKQHRQRSMHVTLALLLRLLSLKPRSASARQLRLQPRSHHCQARRGKQLCNEAAARRPCAPEVHLLAGYKRTVNHAFITSPCLWRFCMH